MNSASTSTKRATTLETWSHQTMKMISGPKFNLDFAGKDYKSMSVSTRYSQRAHRPHNLLIRT